MRSSTWKDAEVIAMTGRFVNMAAHPDTHHEQKPDGCPMYSGVTCEQHETVYRKAAGTAAENGIVQMGTTLFLDLKGNMILRTGAVYKGPDYVKKMREALEKMPGPGIDRETWEKVRPALAAGRGFLGQGLIPEARREFKKLEASKDEAVRKLGKRSIGQLITKGRRMAVQAKLRPNIKEIQAGLLEVADKFEGLVVGEEAEAALENLEAIDEARRTISRGDQAFKREAWPEAIGRYREAVASSDADMRLLAEAKLRQIELKKLERLENAKDDEERARIESEFGGG